jgi:hypothetical protein
MVTTFETPKHPSAQLRTVLLYFDVLKVWNIVELGQLFADDFVQSTRPLSLAVPSRTKEEDLEFLRGFSQQLDGKHLEVMIHPSSPADFLHLRSLARAEAFLLLFE